jgi:hypothetical protein
MPIPVASSAVPSAAPEGGGGPSAHWQPSLHPTLLVTRPSAEIRTELYPRHGCCGLRPPRLEEPVQDYGSLPVEIALASLLPFPPVRTCYNPRLHLDLPTLRVGLLKAPFLRFADALWSPASAAKELLTFPPSQRASVKLLVHSSTTSPVFEHRARRSCLKSRF